MRLLLLGLTALLMGDPALALAPKILVLGGTGFIGSAISKMAIDSGCEVLYVFIFICTSCVSCSNCCELSPKNPLAITRWADATCAAASLLGDQYALVPSTWYQYSCPEYDIQSIRVLCVEGYALCCMFAACIYCGSAVRTRMYIYSYVSMICTSTRFMRISVLETYQKTLQLYEQVRTAERVESSSAVQCDEDRSCCSSRQVTFLALCRETCLHTAVARCVRSILYTSAWALGATAVGSCGYMKSFFWGVILARVVMATPLPRLRCTCRDSTHMLTTALRLDRL